MTIAIHGLQRQIGDAERQIGDAERHALGWCETAVPIFTVSSACFGFPNTMRGPAVFLQIRFVHSWATGPAYRDTLCQHEAAPGWVICLFPSVTLRRSR